MADNDEKLHQWPDVDTVTTAELADKIVEFCRVLARREQEPRERLLAAAKEIWPKLYEALRLNGKVIPNGWYQQGPQMPAWAKEPRVPTEGYIGRKVKNKTEAMQIALTVGDGGWATMPELWLWVVGVGPIVDRTMQKLGYGPKEKK